MRYILTVVWKSGTTSTSHFDEDGLMLAIKDLMVFAHVVTKFTVTPDPKDL